MKRSLPIVFSVLLLAGCGNGDNKQPEQKATPQQAEQSISHSETNKQDYPPHKPQGCDPDLGKYAPYGCDEQGIANIPEGTPVYLRCAIAKGEPCTNEENAQYKQMWNSQGYDDNGNKK